MVASYSGYGYERVYGEICLYSGRSGLSWRNRLPAGDGQGGSAPPPGKRKIGGAEGGLKKTTMLVLAVTLHNIPEGFQQELCWQAPQQETPL